MRRIQWWLVAALAPVAVILILSITLGVNIPQQDDFDSILSYLLGSQDSWTTGLFDIHVSHRLVATRLLARLSVLINGTLDLRLLMLLGTLALFGNILLVYRSLNNTLPRQYLILIFSLISLSLFHWSNLLWATAAVQNSLGLFVALLCLSLFSKQTRSAVIMATLLAAAAPYISSNGLLLLPLLCVWALSRKRSLLAVSLFVLTMLSFAIYLAGFDDSLQLTGGETNALFSLASLLGLASNFLVALAGYLHFKALAMLAGAVLTTYYGYLVYHRYDRVNAYLFYSITYLLLNVALIALFRGNQTLDQLIASRYQVFTLTLLALCMMSFFELDLDARLPIKPLRSLVLALCALFYLSSLYYVGNLFSERQRVLDGVQHWQDSGEFNALYHPEPSRAGEILARSVERGIYRPPNP